jgi:hypothetical protein
MVWSYPAKAKWRLEAYLVLGVTLASAVVQVLALSLMRYAWPLEDDYQRYVRAMQHSLYECLRIDRAWASGRSLSAGLSYWMGQHYGLWFYRSALAAVWLMFVFALFALFCAVLPRAISTWLKILLAILFASLVWADMPSPGQSVYWLTGALENSLGWSLLVFAGATAYASRCIAIDKRIRRWSLSLISGAFSFLAGSTHELVALVGLWSFFTWIVLDFILLRDYRTIESTLFPALALLAATVVTISAPGNFVRFESMEQFGEHSLLNSLGLGAFYFTTELPRILSNVGWIGFLSWLFGLVAEKTKPDATSTLPRELQIAATTILCLVGAVAIVFIFPSYAIGSRMPGRTLNAAHLVVELAILIAIVIIASLPVIADIGRKFTNRVTMNAAISMCILGLWGGQNIGPAVVDLVKRAPDFDRQLQQRAGLFAVQSREAPQRIITVNSIRPWPALYYDADVAPDPSMRFNTFIAAFYGVAGVRWQPPPPE